MGPAMDFTIPDELLELKERTERFVRDQILPRETDARLTPHGPTEEFRRELIELARAAGLLSPPSSRRLVRKLSHQSCSLSVKLFGKLRAL